MKNLAGGVTFSGGEPLEQSEFLEELLNLDQHLYPFYKKGLGEGTLNQEKAKELLESSDLNLIHF